MQTRRAFLFSALGATAAVFLAQASPDPGSRMMPEFHAGSGKAWVTFDGMNWPVDGFSGQHDLPGVRVLLLERARSRLCIVVVELTSLSEETIAEMKAVIQETTHVPADNIVICASHTFSVPHIFPQVHIPPGTSIAQNQEMVNRFKTALLTAAEQAMAHMQPARLGCGSGLCKVNINRDQPGKNGWWPGRNSDGFTDPFVGVIRIDDRHGQPLAVLFNYAVQSSVTEGFQPSSQGKLISADLAGSAARYIEEHTPANPVALFLVGAAGDQAPIFQAIQTVVNDNGSVSHNAQHIDAYKMLHQLGARLGEEVVKVMATIVSSTPARLQIMRQHITVPALHFTPENAPKGPVTTFHYQPAGNTQVPVTLVQMGESIWIGLQPELSAITAAYIRKHSPFRHTLISIMVDGAAKYMPDAKSYERFTYEARSSPFAPGAAERLATAIIQQLNILHADI